MGVINAGILSPFSGKVAGVVGAKWKGIAYMRAYAIPGNPNTIAQQSVRNVFRMLQLLGGTFLVSIMQKFWDPFIRKMSGYNHFIGFNLPNVPLPTNFNLVKMSNGKLEGTPTFAAVYSPLTGIVATTWDSTVLGNGDPTDNIVLVFFDTANKIGFVDDGGTQRGAAAQNTNIGAGRVAADIECYAFFYRGFGSNLFIVSPSIYDNGA